MSDVASEHIKVRCPGCNKKLAFKPAAAGRKVKCPACEHVFRVPAGAPAGAAAAPAAEKEAGEGGSLFDALAAAEQSAEVAQMGEEEAAMARAAAEASAAVERAAQGGVVYAAGAAGQGAEAKGVGRLLKPGDPDASFLGRDGAMLALLRGIAFSVLGALGVDVVWYLVARSMDGLSPGIMTLLVGCGAALGMTLGIRSETKIAGVLAVAITWFGILFGQAAILTWIVIPKLVAEMKVVEDSIDFQKRVVTQSEIDKVYEKAEAAGEQITPGRAKELRREGIINASKYTTDDMVRAEYQRIKGPPPAPKPVATMWELMKDSMFSYGTLLCSVGALIVAFFVGSGILSLGIE